MSAIALFACLALSPSSEITLERKFTKGEQRSYRFVSELVAEASQTGIPIAIPEELGFEFDFNYKVEEVLPSGFAKIRYVRPKTTMVLGETFDTPIQRRDADGTFDFRMSLSPINEVTEIVDLTPKNKPKKEGNWISSSEAESQRVLNLSVFSQDLYRLSLMIGHPAQSADFSPKLPFEPVKVGDTWRRTVGYQPQNLKGDAAKKQAMQKVDMVYTYAGPKMRNGKRIELVTAAVDLDTEAKGFLNSLLQLSEKESPIKSFKLMLKLQQEYELDPETLATIRMTGKSEGSFTTQIDTGQGMRVRLEKVRGKMSLTEIPAKK